MMALRTATPEIIHEHTRGATNASASSSLRKIVGNLAP